ncbi:MAG: ABC transporter permease, partial [Clostridiales bacterium]|nr:ABC transporter permease [Clostridiales bacterium]
FLSIRIKEPLAALFLFFIAVILVILGTYALFMAGSVVFCRLLQKNKRYYYKPNHFVSVSSMVYRMRRNGAGLASICILLTMVLVMISSTASLYFGAEDALFRRYPHDVNLTVHFQSMEDMRDEKTDTLKQELIAVCGEALAADSPYLVVVPGLITEEGLIFDYGAYDDFSLATYNDLGYLSVLSLEDYNLISDSVEVLEDDACILFHSGTNFASDTFTLENGMPYQVQKVLDSFPGTENTTALVLPQIFIVVKDPTAFLEPVRTVENRWGKTLLTYKWNGGFDFSSPQEALASEHAIREALHRLQAEGTHGILSYQVDSREFHRNDFFGTFGSLFFLGIMLSIVFLLAAVLIIYYKQISEGYEDQSRFEIMQKVGMTKKDIRKSINSQMLTVFFLPLLFAGIHLCFAFPFLWRILTLFALNNMLFVIVVMLICFAIFGLFYTLVYKITAGAYYAIVSG